MDNTGSGNGNGTVIIHSNETTNLVGIEFVFHAHSWIQGTIDIKLRDQNLILDAVPYPIIPALQTRRYQFSSWTGTEVLFDMDWTGGADLSGIGLSKIRLWGTGTIPVALLPYQVGL